MLLLSFRISAMTHTEAIQYVNRYYDLLNQYAVVKNDAPGLARQITSMHVENAGSIYPDVEVKLGGLPDTKGVVISTYLTSVSDPERKKSMLLKFVPKDITIKSNSGGVTCVSYTLYVYDDNATPNTSVLKYSIPLEMRINQYYKIKSITKRTNGQENDDTPKTPNVSKKVQTHNGHEYVDLGLSVMWATCNVGASKPEDYGGYFQWGHTKPTTIAWWWIYKWCTGARAVYPRSEAFDGLTKYCINPSERHPKNKVDNKKLLDLSDDAARANWGGSWRMPTQAELEELLEKCTWTQLYYGSNGYKYSGVKGYKVTSKINGNSIFLPGAGYLSMLDNVYEHRNYYWSSSLGTGRSSFAYCLYEGYDSIESRIILRCYGLPIRPVFSPQ